MAEQFLAGILTVENSVESEEGRDCIICQEKFGTPSCETGIMELEVRLPCNHTMGSACIATWLSSNNTCPLCRREFFPRQPRPYMEHEAMETTEDDFILQLVRTEGESDEDYLARLASNAVSLDNPLALVVLHSPSLHLSLQATLLALPIAMAAEGMVSWTFEHSSTAIAAASMYVASHILHQPRSLPEVARVTAVSERLIHNAYRTIYFNRYELIDEDWPEIVGIVGGRTLGEAAEALPSLSFPPLQYEFTDGEGEDEGRMVEEYDSPQSILALVKLRNFFLHGPDYFVVDPDNNHTLIMADMIADQVETLTLDCNTVNPWTLAAAYTYMASHLVRQGKTYEEISAMAGIPSAWIRNTYQVIYGARREIVQEEWYGLFPWMRDVALAGLPEP